MEPPQPPPEGSWAAFWSLVVAAWAALLTAFGIHVKSARERRDKVNDETHAAMQRDWQRAQDKAEEKWRRIEDKVDDLAERLAKIEGQEGR